MVAPWAGQGYRGVESVGNPPGKTGERPRIGLVLRRLRRDDPPPPCVRSGASGTNAKGRMLTNAEGVLLTNAKGVLLMLSA